MIKRREIREATMQLLFAHDLHGKLRDEDREAYWHLHSAKPKLRAIAEEMTRDILARLPEIDELISGAVQNYSFERINSVDRNILRLGTYEMLCKTDIPHPVVISEAIGIASRFATEESAKFVNGVLDRISRTLTTRVVIQTPKPKS